MSLPAENGHVLLPIPEASDARIFRELARHADKLDDLVRVLATTDAAVAEIRVALAMVIKFWGIEKEGL